MTALSPSYLKEAKRGGAQTARLFAMMGRVTEMQTSSGAGSLWQKMPGLF